MVVRLVKKSSLHTKKTAHIVEAKISSVAPFFALAYLKCYIINETMLLKISRKEKLMIHVNTIKAVIHATIAKVALKRHPEKIYCNISLPKQRTVDILKDIPVDDNGVIVDLARQTIVCGYPYYFRAYYDDNTVLGVHLCHNAEEVPSITGLGKGVLLYTLMFQDVGSRHTFYIAVSEKGDVALNDDEAEDWTLIDDEGVAVERIHEFWNEFVKKGNI
jgi:hypothetical protein